MTTMIQSAFGNLAILLGAFAGALVIADWLMPKNTKDWIKDRASTAWIWLSYQRTWPYLRRLQNPIAFDLFFLTTCAFVFFAFMWIIWRQSSFENALEASEFKIDSWKYLIPILMCLVPIIGYLICRRWLRAGFTYVMRADTSGRLLARSGLALLTLYAALFVLIGFIVLTGFGLAKLGGLAGPAQYLFAALFLIVWLVSLLGFFLLYALLVLMLYMGTIYLIIVIFKLAEFILIRTLEYDKGPVLAVAAFLTACGSVLKAFAG